LWATALAISLLANVLIVAVLGFTLGKLNEEKHRASGRVASPSRETVVLLVPPVPPNEEPVEEPEALPDRRFARTSEAQRADAPDAPRFIGERDTRATSDAPPNSDGPPLPSQLGETPRHEADLETTEGNFQEGPDGPDALPMPEIPPAPIVPPTPLAEAASDASGEDIEDPKSDESRVEGAREAVASSIHPMDVPVPPEPLPEMPEVIEPKRPEVGDSDQGESELAEQPANAPVETPRPPRPPVHDPAFRSNQRKAAISGSITRTGISSLDVANTPIGRYQAAISKAVEQEWRRNCVRHKDFITPGFLSVRFFVQGDGKVRNVDFVGNMHTGEIQKGFTLSSIRDAPLPAMPPEVKAELDGEPMELIFNFYF
jgi:hypothetical protein